MGNDLTVVELEKPVDLIVLCGGLGTRLSSRTLGRPKIMVELPDGSLFIDHFVAHLPLEQFNSITFSAGSYSGLRSDLIEEHISKLAISKEGKMRVVQEATKLNTAGAVSWIMDSFDFHRCFVINGDTLLTKMPNFLAPPESNCIWRADGINIGLYYVNHQMNAGDCKGLLLDDYFDLYLDSAEKLVINMPGRAFYDIGTPERLDYWFNEKNA